MIQYGEFSQFVEFVKTQKEQGMCTAYEATMAILDKAQEMLQSLRIDDTQFMKDQSLSASNIN
jgi:tRNA(Ile2) C34 agmatinyltransferase TiaS